MRQMRHDASSAASVLTFKLLFAGTLNVPVKEEE